MKHKGKDKKSDTRRLLFDDVRGRSLTSLFAIAVHEFNKANLLNLFIEILDKVGSKQSVEYRLLQTYIGDLEKDGPLTTGTTTTDKGYKTLVIDLKDLATIKKYAKPFKRELAKLVLDKYGSYLEYANKANLQPSNVSKFFSQQTESKPRISTMEKFIQLLGITEITIKVYSDDQSAPGQSQIQS